MSEALLQGELEESPASSLKCLALLATLGMHGVTSSENLYSGNSASSGTSSCKKAPPMPRAWCDKLLEQLEVSRLLAGDSDAPALRRLAGE